MRLEEVEKMDFFEDQAWQGRENTFEYILSISRLD